MRISPRYFSVLLLTALFVSATAVTSAEENSYQNPRPGMADLLETVTPAVVNIAVEGHVDTPQSQNPLLNDPMFRQFFGVPNQPQSRQFQSAGSGVIIDAAKGYVITNHHVIDHADDIQVTLLDTRSYPATLIGSDAATDIALLQIDAEDLSEVKLSDSETLRVGDLVMAIGNPFGIGQTVTTGMVGALGRAGINPDGNSVYEDFIQTDASINPGNSGGALIDYNGELIGINSAIIAPSGGNVGIGFAVPSNMAMAVVDQLLEFGEIKRGLLGVQIQDLPPDLAASLDLDIVSGAVVVAVQPGSAASAAGIEPGDVITAVNGESIKGSADLRNTVGLIRAGSDIELDVVRDQQRLQLQATISNSNPVATTVSGSSHKLLEGVELSAIPETHQASGKIAGVLVSGVVQNSRAWRNQLRPNDIITAVNKMPVASVADLEAAMSGSRGPVALSIVRDDQRLFLILR